MGSAKTALVMMILASWLVSEAWCSSRRIVSESAETQTLNIYLVDAPLIFAAQGKALATHIFKDIGIALHWHAGRRPKEAGPEAIEIRIGSAPASEARYALAATFFPDRTIIVYLDRIREQRDQNVEPALFGHVLAHEIGHVLQGKTRHSPEGILKQSWTPGDYSDTVAGRLTFTGEDVRLIRLSPLLKTTALLATFQSSNKVLR